MASWATKRKIIYLSIVFAVIFLLLVVPLFLILYEKPTCFDGKKNGDEIGTDCGGSCVSLCRAETLEPIVLWSRAFKVLPGFYSVLAYVENPNVNSQAQDVPYVFNIYDNKNILIASKQGTIFIPGNKIFAIFQPNISVQNKVPARVAFEFTGKPSWKRVTTDSPEIVVRNKDFSRDDPTPRVAAILENRSIKEVLDMEVVAIVYDGKDNAVGASRTYVDYLEKEGTANVVFTWPYPFETQSEACKLPADVMLVVDRSGSMASDQKEPPQPLADVKNAAILFLNQLSPNDRAGLVTFATESSFPIDSPLTPNLDLLKKVIEAVSIKTDGMQNTNIGEGILKAREALFGASLGSRPVIVALTDGIANRPSKENEPKYAESYALTVATLAKEKGIKIYTIGLGNNVNEEFLKSLATSPEYYFAAATSKNLNDIYSQVASAICKDSPTTIEIITRILPRGSQ